MTKKQALKIVTMINRLDLILFELVKGSYEEKYTREARQNLWVALNSSGWHMSLDGKLSKS